MSDKKPLVALAAGTVASVGGTRLSAIAIPWLVLTSTGDPVLTGVVGMAELLPYVAAKAFGGPFIDRIGARRISIWSDGLSAIAVASVPSLYWIDLLSVWLLLPAVALIGILRAPSDAAKQALVPSVASMGKMPLERTTGILGASDRLAGTLGAAGGGALIALIGAAPALLTNAVAFLLASLVVGLGIPRPTVADTAKPRTSATYLHDLAAGWSTLRNESILVTLVLMLAITNLFDQAYATVLLPVWVRSSGLSVTWVGIFLAAFSGAAVAGAAMAAAFAERLPRMLVYTTGFLCAGPAPMAALALDPRSSKYPLGFADRWVCRRVYQSDYRGHLIRTHPRSIGGAGDRACWGARLGSNAIWRPLCRTVGRHVRHYIGIGRNDAALFDRNARSTGHPKLSRNEPKIDRKRTVDISG